MPQHLFQSFPSKHSTGGCWHGCNSLVIHERGRATKHLPLQYSASLGTDPLSASSIPPSPRSCPLGFQRSFLIVSVIEDWHSSMPCQAAKNKSNWLLANVIGWLVAIACLAATTVRRADHATSVLWWSSASNLTTMAVSHYLWMSSLVQTRESQRHFICRDFSLRLRAGRKRE